MTSRRRRDIESGRLTKKLTSKDISRVHNNDSQLTERVLKTIASPLQSPFCGQVIFWAIHSAEQHSYNGTHPPFRNMRLQLYTDLILASVHNDVYDKVKAHWIRDDCTCHWEDLALLVPHLEPEDARRIGPELTSEHQHQRSLAQCTLLAARVLSREVDLVEDLYGEGGFKQTPWGAYMAQRMQDNPKFIIESFTHWIRREEDTVPIGLLARFCQCIPSDALVQRLPLFPALLTAADANVTRLISIPKSKQTAPITHALGLTEHSLLGCACRDLGKFSHSLLEWLPPDQWSSLLKQNVSKRYANLAKLLVLHQRNNPIKADCNLHYFVGFIERLKATFDNTTNPPSLDLKASKDMYKPVPYTNQQKMDMVLDFSNILLRAQMESRDLSIVNKILKSALSNPFKTPFCYISVEWALESLMVHQDKQPSKTCPQNVHLFDFLLSSCSDDQAVALRAHWTRPACGCEMSEPMLGLVHATHPFVSKLENPRMTALDRFRYTFDGCLLSTVQKLVHSIQKSATFDTVKNIKDLDWGIHIRRRVRADPKKAMTAIINWINRVQNDLTSICIFALVVTMMRKEDFFALASASSELRDIIDNRLRAVNDRGDEQAVRFSVLSLAYYVHPMNGLPVNKWEGLYRPGSEKRANTVFEIVERCRNTLGVERDATFFMILINFAARNLRMGNPRQKIPEVARDVQKNIAITHFIPGTFRGSADYTFIINFVAVDRGKCHNGRAHFPPGQPGITPLSPDCTLSKCSGCQVMRYCSRDCQVKMWKSHKPFCKNLARFRQAQIEYDKGMSAIARARYPSSDVNKRNGEVQKTAQSVLDGVLEKIELSLEEVKQLARYCRDTDISTGYFKITSERVIKF